MAAARNRRASRRRPKVVVIAAQFNHAITRQLADGALAALAQHGIPKRAIRTLWVPGAFELPVAAAYAATTWHPEAIVAVGCLIKGQTSQYAAIGHAVAEGLAQVSVQQGVPVGFGVIVAETFAQATARSGGRVANRGRDAALAAIAMMDLFRSVGQRGA